MVLRFASCSPQRSGFLVTVTPEKLASQELDAGVEASGPHDFAVRKLAHSSPTPPASIASRSALMTLRNAPLSGQDGESCRSDLPDARSQIFLQRGLDREIYQDRLICPSGWVCEFVPVNSSGRCRPTKPDSQHFRDYPITRHAADTPKSTRMTHLGSRRHFKTLFFDV
jgi:hypothetical protein